MNFVVFQNMQPDGKENFNTVLTQSLLQISFKLF